MEYSAPACGSCRIDAALAHARRQGERCGAVAGSGRGERLPRDLPWMAPFAAAGLVLAALAAALLDRALLPGGMGPELRRGNLAAGITSAGHRIACGVIAGSCLYGADLPTLAVGVAFVAHRAWSRCSASSCCTGS